MEYLSEDHCKLLLAKEWLVKVDNDTSTPYLFKFYASTVDLRCFIVITDTKHVWGEVLPSNRLARRWRDCNPQQSIDSLSEDEEESWRTKCLEFLTAVHSLGGIADPAFELVKSSYSDLAFELRNDTFRWRWETFSVGPTMSADILSKHLIMPLISTVHLSFFSADPVSSLSEADVEKSADRIGRIGRRAVDTHVKNTLSKPLVATTLRRMGAVFNFVPDPPRILADVNAPDLAPPSPPVHPRALLEPLISRKDISQPTLQGFVAVRPMKLYQFPRLITRTKGEGSKAKTSASRTPPRPLQDDDSATEEEPDEDSEELLSLGGQGKKATNDHRSRLARPSSPARLVPSKRVTPDHPAPPASRETTSSGPGRNSSSPVAPPKKAKRLPAADSSSDSASENEHKGRTGQGQGGARRGVKQPIRRGGKRF